MSTERTVFEYLLEQAPDAIFWTRRDGTFEYVNQAACTLLGYSREQLLELCLFDIDADLEPLWWSEHWDQSRVGDVYTLDRRHRCNGGETLPVEVCVRCVQWRGEFIHASFVRDRSEAKRLEKLRISQETFYHALFTKSPAPQLIIDPQTGHIVDANAAALNFYGYDAQTLLGKPVSDINELSPDQIRDEIDRAVRAEKRYFEFRHRLVTGDIRDVQVFSKPIERDGTTLLHSTIQDVTSTLQYQRQLENYREQLEQLPVGVFRNTPEQEGVFIWVNQRLMNMLDATSVDELVGKPVSDFYHDPGERKAFSHRLEASGDVYRDSLELVTLRNRRIWVAITAHTIRDADGRLLFEGAAEDITHARAQREQLRLVDAAFENAHEGIMLTDAEGAIIRVNKAFKRITGYRPDEVIGRNPRVLSSGLHDSDFYRQMWASLASNGCWQGEIWNHRKDGTTLPEYLSISAIRDVDGQITNYLGQFTDLTDLRETQASLRNLADFDPLTGLPNRKNLLESIERLVTQCRSGAEAVVLLVFGIDNFRQINDVLSPSQGNLALKQLAQRIQSKLPESMQVFRASGDIFALLGKGRQVDQLLERMNKMVDGVIQNEFLIGDHDNIKFEFSRGSTFSSDPEHNPETLFTEAEAAMFHAKEHRRGRHVPYSLALTEDARENLVIEGELRRAIANQELTVHLQPIVRVADDAPRAVEALVRWFHPTEGMIPPDRFIPVAESSGLIRELTLLVVSLACEETVLINEKTGLDLRLAVNVSSPLITDPTFIDTLLQSATNSGLPLNRLELEITESLLMQQYDQFTDILKSLRSEEVRISIDDFGTGYSSLAYLQELDADTLKVDRRFVNHATDSAKGGQLAASIIAMARELGMEVIGEGVETPQELAFLRHHRCDLYQGYFFSRPQPGGTLIEMLTDR